MFKEIRYTLFCVTQCFWQGLGFAYPAEREEFYRRMNKYETVE